MSQYATLFKNSQMSINQATMAAVVIAARNAVDAGRRRGKAA
jgi:hypothetical protein